MARTFELKSPLGANLLFSSASVSEEVSGLFDIQIDALSRMQNIEPHTLLGEKVTIVQNLDSKGGKRFFNGHCVRLEQTGLASPGYFSYRLYLKPWLWFLSRRSDSRIHQKMPIPDVLKKVLEIDGRADFDPRLKGQYAAWDYCVQYRESDLNFVMRLMEQEGIYFFFEHGENEHKMVLCDSASTHKPIEGTVSLPFYRPGSVKAGVEHIDRWSFSQEIQSGKVSIDEYDPTQPSKPLFASRTTEDSKLLSLEKGLEIYDYPGEYDTEDEGRTYAGLRLEEQQTRRQIFQGGGEAAWLSAGRKFKLEKHPIKENNGEYFLTGVRSRFSEGAQEAGAPASLDIQVSFSAIKHSQQYRPARITPKPIISGVQTALVTGPAGEEIYTDKLGRVCVQFFWDRRGEHNEKSSCWIRAAMPWASGQFGIMTLPRIGDEVVVTFMEGDPDRPLITGSVYNAENKPPYSFPENKTQSGIRTKSSKGGGSDNFNEILFEDKKGSELLGMQAEKDMHLLVKNERLENVKAENHLTVGGADFEKVGNKQHIDVKLDQSIKVGGTHSLSASQDWMVKAGMALNAEAGQEIHLKSGLNMVLEASVGLTLKVGGNFISLTPAGIFIQGTMVMINSGGSPGSGSGLRLNSPDAARVGKSNSATGKKPERRGKVTEPSGAGGSLKEAAKSGSSFCEVCNGC